MAKTIFLSWENIFQGVYKVLHTLVGHKLKVIKYTVEP